MASQFFMRVRGRVLGPYDEDKLQSLARRGQLSRMHELSTDGVSWTRASAYPDLFAGAVMETVAVAAAQVQEPQSTVAATGQSDAPHSTGAAKPQAQWFYTSGGTQRGPIDYSQLQLLVATAQLGPDDQVWTEGMPAWVSASAIPGLARSPSGAASAASGNSWSHQDGNQKLPAALVKSAVSSRLWATLVAAVMDVFGATVLVGCFIWLVMAAQVHSAIGVANAIVHGLNAIVVIVWGLVLHNYCSKLGALSHDEDIQSLEDSQDALRAFWTFTSIYLIVLLTFFAILVIYVFAAGITISNISREWR
jgi:hypothetical protein